MIELSMISVVMSVYNAEKYLDEAIESIINQTYRNFEFIIINDGSNDKSLEIIKKYKNQDERIVLISRENRGLISSLNEGIERAKGKYIARMDADDISLSTRFEEQIKFMEENSDVGVCGTGIIGFGLDIDSSVNFYTTSNEQLKAELLFSSIFAHPTVVIRKNLIDTYNLYYDEGFKYAEDFELWVRMAEYTKFANIKKPLLKYRILQNSITREADRDVENRYKTIRPIVKKELIKLSINNNEEENILHFNLSVNSRIRDNDISFSDLKKYFSKLSNANKKNKIYNEITLKKVLGKKWLWNLYYRKEVHGLFSQYFIYGLWSIIKK
ncbi:MAG: Glycosyl transferase family 2 [uncultured Sulfurovum sp.]|uniref:Glycosyl transferase family 2 n=1 Tax=uncultured Sulfurovum sp. TaxID=269237 RepID=A0A6S6TV79_9BACT|nr:MAG: Glycosyl transferase family 2 [uncultured Sulfurovum sp.]